MIIANPIYDTIFKHLMNDLGIAKGFISTILRKKIYDIQFLSQENSSYIPENDIHDKIKLFHLDFIAEIETDNGKKKVLIELQKTNAYAYPHRFRAYIGELYTKAKKEYDQLVKDEQTLAKKENRDPHKINEPEILPIIPIFIFGFKLENSPLANELMITEYKRNAYDPNQNNEVIKVTHQLAEYLSHDLIIIQIPFIPNEPKTELEIILSIFEQRFLQEDHWYKDYRHHFTDPLLLNMLKKLEILTHDKKISKRLNAEEEGQLMYGNIMAGKKEMEKELELKEKELKHKDKELEHKDKELETAIQILVENLGISVEKAKIMINKKHNKK